LIKVVVRGENDDVVAIDEKAQCVQNCCGSFKEVKKNVEIYALASTQFYGKLKIEPVSKEEWLNEK
jgi:hypothetical protein